MSTTLHSTDDLEQLARRLRGLPTVVSVDVVASDPELGRPSLEVLVGPGFDRIPPTVIRLLRTEDLGVRDVQVRGGFFAVAAV